MNTHRLLLTTAIMLLCLVSSCTNELDEKNGYAEGEKPIDRSLRITTVKKEYRVGELVKFEIRGDVDSIIVYSGDKGHNYLYKDGKSVDLDHFITFESQSRDGVQTDQMRILISKDFTEDYSITGVHNATWNDLTSKFKMAPPGGGGEFISSGDGGFKEFLNADEPEVKLHIAVKQNVLNQTEHGKGNLNRIRNLRVKSTDSSVVEHKDLNFQLFSTPNKQPGRASLENDSTILMRDSWKEEFFSNNTEDWAVSKVLSLSFKKDLGASEYVVIKRDASEGKIGSHTYIYTDSGKFEVVFIATIDKGNASEREEIIKIILDIVD